MSIVEVAKAAGVSTATVSRVLNNLPGVRPETIAQVRAAVSELSYTPQRTRPPKKRPGRNVKLRTGNIAIITIGHDRTWLEIPVLASVVGGVMRGVTASELRLMFGEMYDPTKPSPLLVNRQIDGAIVFLSSEVPIARYEATFKAMQRHVPVVWAMGMEMAVSGVDHVTPDNVGVGHLAYTYLRKLGCEHLGFVTANPQWPLIRLRGQSFMNCALDGGFPPTMYLIGNDDHVGDAYGRRVVVGESLEALIEKIARSDARPTGLFVANDHTTSYVYPLLAKHGLRIGKDVHIVSCDNEEARLAGMHPRPASIDIGAEEIGYRAVNRLLNRIERPNGPPLIIQVTPRLQMPPGTE